MNEWWASLTALEQIYAYLAIPATVVLIAQVILTLIGFWGDGSDAPDGDAEEIEIESPEWDEAMPEDGLIQDASLEGETGTGGEEEPEMEDHSFRLLTVRGMVAFLAIGGWTGLSMLRTGHSPWWSIPVSFLAGAAAMVLMALVLYSLIRFQSSGTLDYRNALGQEGEVYLTVPPEGQGNGKIQIVIQESLRECAAQQEGKMPLPTGTPVIVTGIREDGVLMVKPR